jgi:uncharacterized protein (DUF952 family)
VTRVYKILSRRDWDAAQAAGRFEGSADDARDGFIHLSAADQVAETARRYFAGRADLTLVAFEAEALGPGLKWEPSRGGALFPHLYGPLPTAAALDARALPLDGDGVPDPGGLAP